MRDKEDLNISEEQEQEIKDHFYKPVQNMVYWSFYENNKIFSHLYQGTITKEFDDYVKTLDKKNAFTFIHLLIIMMKLIMLLKTIDLLKTLN